MSVTLILTGTTLETGKITQTTLNLSLMLHDSILEYMSREEAERAAKDLDGKELRGRSVRVLLDDSAVSALV
jgi:hypothetical protein